MKTVVIKSEDKHLEVTFQRVTPADLKLHGCDDATANALNVKINSTTGVQDEFWLDDERNLITLTQIFSSYAEDFLKTDNNGRIQ